MRFVIFIAALITLAHAARVIPLYKAVKEYLGTCPKSQMQMQISINLLKLACIEPAAITKDASSLQTPQCQAAAKHGCTSLAQCDMATANSLGC